MIKRWGISNYKSIAAADLNFAMLTIVCGVNNVGKSSLIQSILLASQTLGNRDDDNALVLNGHLYRCGYFSDIKNRTTSDEEVAFSFECIPNRMTRKLWNLRLLAQSDELESVSVAANFVDHLWDRDLDPTKPMVSRCRLEVQNSVEDSSVSHAFLETWVCSNLTKRIEKLAHNGFNADQIQNTALGSLYEVEMDNDSKFELLQDQPDGLLMGCVLNHFLPDRPLIRFNVKKEVAGRMVRILIKIAIGVLPPHYNDVTLPVTVVDYLNDFFRSKFSSIILWQGITFLELKKKVLLSKLHIKKDFRRSLQDIRDELESHWAEALDGLPEYEVKQLPLPDLLNNGASYVSMFLANQIRYLGPLRDEPKSLCPLPTIFSKKDVGLRGEHTAYVLHRERSSIVTHIPPEAFTSGALITVEESLTAALEKWLAYLQIGTSIFIENEGKLGYSMKIVPPNGGTAVDPTHLGVGVSQILPVLVLGLLSEVDDMLLFEQPEIHLHPLPQTRLADFFLSLCLSGRQCLIETHSEHMIRRIRHRIAKDDSDTIRESTKIYFAEQKEGATHFRSIDINQYGALVDWPEGFFDEADLEAQNIVQAAILKKMRGKSKHGNSAD